MDQCSFNFFTLTLGATRPLPVIQSEGSKRLPRRARSERSKTVPNNVFDVASDRLTRLFTSSSSPEPTVCYHMLNFCFSVSVNTSVPGPVNQFSSSNLILFFFKPQIMHLVSILRFP